MKEKKYVSYVSINYSQYKQIDVLCLVVVYVDK